MSKDRKDKAKGKHTQRVVSKSLPFIFRYERLEDISNLEVLGRVIYERAGSYYWLLGITFSKESIRKFIKNII